MPAQIEDRPCPVCEGREGIEISMLRDVPDPQWERLQTQTPRSRWVVCAKCACVYQTPAPTDAELGRLYSEMGYVKEPNDRDLAEHFLVLGIHVGWRRAMRALREYRKAFGTDPRRVFEIGCGSAEDGVFFRNRGIDYSAVEPDPRLVRFAKDALGLQVSPGFFDASVAEAGKGRWDMIYSCHVLEHLRDLGPTLRLIRESLSERGMLFSVVPTFQNGRTSEALANFGKLHMQLFDHQSLSAACAKQKLFIRGWTYHGDLYSENEL